MRGRVFRVVFGFGKPGWISNLIEQKKLLMVQDTEKRAQPAKKITDCAGREKIAQAIRGVMRVAEIGEIRFPLGHGQFQRIVSRLNISL